MSQDKDPNQGEGDRTSARRYDRSARKFVVEGKVPDAASEAKAYVERDPDGAARAERRARKGPHDRTVDELVAKGHTVLDRGRAIVERAVAGLRARFSRDREAK